MLSTKRTRIIAVVAAAIVLGGGSYGIATAASGSAPATAASSPAGGPGPGGFGSGEGSNARSGPAAGGSSGTISGVSSSGFTLTTSTGEKVTIKEASSTTYENGTSPAAASAVTTGEPVLVLGTTDSTTITAAEVIVHPPSGSASNPGGHVIGYTEGEQGSSQQVGQIPADYKQGSGTIVSGAAANAATEAALDAYPGGIVDRVVKIGNGQYEVHYIGVNWPHHIFVSQNFEVIGADD
jgi:hypothetical protein